MVDSTKKYPDLSFAQYTFVCTWLVAKIRHLEERNIPVIDQYLAEWFALMKPKIAAKYENDECRLPCIVRSRSDTDQEFQRKMALFTKRVALGALQRMKHDKMINVIVSDGKDLSRFVSVHPPKLEYIYVTTAESATNSLDQQ